MTRSAFELPYILEKLDAAIDGMAYSSRSLKDRLHGAFISLGMVSAWEFPGELADEWLDIHREVTAIADEEAGSYRASIEAMSSEKAEEIARMLVEFRHSVRNHIGD